MSEVADYSRGEPKPEPNDSDSMHDLVAEEIRRFWSTYPAAAKADLLAELHERKLFGLKKYGTPLQANNGRVPLNDAIDEILDLLVYVKQDMVENGTVLMGVYRPLMDIAIRLVHLQHRREHEG